MTQRDNYWIMMQRLQHLVDTVNPRVLGQVLKSQPDLWAWVCESTPELADNVTVRERVTFLLMGKPDRTCKYNKTRTFSKTRHEYGFCDNQRHCACLREHMDLVRPAMDVARVVTQRRETWLKKYGVANAAQSEQVKQRRRATMAARDYTALRARLARDLETQGFHQVIQRVSAWVTPEFTRHEYQGSFRKHRYAWRCVTCDHVFDSHVDYGTCPRCPRCYPVTVSRAELDLRALVQVQGLQFQTNTQEILGRWEYDIYIPDLKLALEFNGAYWHSTKFRPPDYHVNKYTLSRELGIHLVQIFDDQWVQHADVIQRRIQHLLTPHAWPAHQGLVKTLVRDQYEEFCNQYHEFQDDRADIMLGLYNQQQLVAVMGLAGPAPDYVITTYCASQAVHQGLTVLFEHVVRTYDPVSVTHRLDRCWYTNHEHLALGFVNVTPDDLNARVWHIKNYVRYPEHQPPEPPGVVTIHDAGEYHMLWQNSVTVHSPAPPPDPAQ